MAGLKSGQMFKSEEYSEHVENFHNNKDYIKVILAADKFKKLEKSFLRDTHYQPPEEKLKYTLNKYIENNPCEDTIEKIEKILKDSDKWKLAVMFIEMFITRLEPKKHTMWLDGDSNTGKTKFIEGI